MINQFVSGFYERGISFSEGEFYEEAISDYTKALEINPRDALAYYNRGILHLNVGRADLAIADFNKVIELSDDPDLVAAARERISEIQRRN